jgi:glycosyltransferase involved in cell wall biosynthesis
MDTGKRDSAGLISIIMPCYNAAAFIEQAIESVLGQIYPDIELIIVDDGSSDESVAIAEQLASRNSGKITLLSQDHKGPYPARNLGLSQATGEFVAFLDADDWWSNTCLSKLHEAITRHNADLAYCGWQNIGKPGSGNEPYIPPRYEDGDIAEAFLRTCPWPIHAALTRRSIIDSGGGFSERRFSAMDYDFWLRIYGQTSKLVLVPEVMAFYRWHDKGQISATQWRQAIDAFIVRKDFVGDNPQLVEHIESDRLWDLTNAPLLKEAYSAFWKRDLPAAQRLFRYAFRQRAWKRADLSHILPSLLPGFMYRFVINIITKTHHGGSK